MTKILILTDYRGAFYSTARTRHGLCSMDVGRVVRQFERAGCRVEVTGFADLNLAADLHGVPVLYTSSEDPDLLYKSWIEDLVLALETAGAHTVPPHRYLRAHHNKVLMEALRGQLFPKEAARLGTRSFGTYEELERSTLDGRWPKVIKSAYGAGSDYVARAADRAELLRLAHAMSRAGSPGETVREHARRLLRREHHPRSLHRRKFLVQEFVPGLSGDFKVLRMGDRYYTLYRRNRPGDFRASGSGDFDFQDTGGVDRDALLDYAERAAEMIDTPLVSLDIGFDGTEFHLIEFQCLHFGTVTAEESTHYHVRRDGAWARVAERCDVEAVFCAAILRHLGR
ncbi:hypothetical protein OG559_01420 [Micromonospora sp. NBC_01405]|uniref:ATP-grasp domain-containing protein n=1 Tax=Micromonospora sp. NBC_01405 TaxID=2903589 RepID=UPI0032434503